MSKKYNFGVRIRPPKQGKKTRTLSTEEQNAILVKKFLRKWKQSGIAKELKRKSYPRTRGMKEREKRFLGKRRARKKS